MAFYCNILKVTLCKADSLACADGESTINGTNRVGAEVCTGKRSVDVKSGISSTDNANILITFNKLSVSSVESNNKSFVFSGRHCNFVSFCSRHFRIFDFQGDGLGAMAIGLNRGDYGIVGIGHIDAEVTVDNLIGSDRNAINSNITANNDFCNTAKIFEFITGIQGLFSIQREVFVKLASYTVLNLRHCKCTSIYTNIPRIDTNDGAIGTIERTTGIHILNKI